MKIKREKLERLADHILARYRAKDLITVKAADTDVKAKIIAVVAANFAEEEAIEEEARKILASHTPRARDLDAFKMFVLAKQKVAAKKGFIL